MKTMTQKQLESFRLRATNVAKMLEVDIKFPDKGEEQTAILTIDQLRAIKVSHDIYRGHFKAQGVWPLDGRQEAKCFDGDEKFLRVDYSKPDEEFAQAIQQRFLPWYDVAIEQVEERMAAKRAGYERALKLRDDLLEALHIKPTKTDSPFEIYEKEIHGFRLSASVDPFESTGVEAAAKVQIVGPAGIETLLAMVVETLGKEAKK